MDPELLALIRAFQTDAARALAVVLKGTGLAHPFDQRQTRTPGRGTFVDPQSGSPVHYFFHGIGLGVETGEGAIDFDFGFDGRTTGFSEWKLREYAQARPIPFPHLSNVSALAAALANARRFGEIKKPAPSLQDSLEYLSAELPTAAT